MDTSSLPKYPLATGERPDDSGLNIDWKLLLARLFVLTVMVGFFVECLFVVAVAVTGGQILLLFDSDFWWYW
jgi:hypothetical protein